MSELEQVWYSTAHLQVTSNIILNNPEPFRAEGLEVFPICPGSGVPIARTMMSGLAGYCNVLALPIQRAVEGWPLKFVASYQNTGWEIWGAPDIKSLKDLEGRTVGRTSGMARRYLNMLLERDGVDPDSVKYGDPVPLDHSAIEEIRTGKVDAGLFMDPVGAMAEKAGLNMIGDLGDAGDPVAFGLMVTEKLLNENRDQVVKMVRATMKSTIQLKNDPDLAKELIRAQGVPSQYVDIAAKHTLARLNVTGELAETSQRQWVEFCKEAASMDMDEDVPLSRLFDFSILKEVMAAL